MAERIAALVYLDAVVPGVSDPLPPPEQSTKEGGVPPPHPSFFGLAEQYRARVDRLLTPQPFGCRVRDYEPTGAWAAVPRRAFLAAEAWAGRGRSLSTLDRLASNPRWETRSLACSHDMMIDEPEALAAYLLTFATEG